MKNHTEMIQCVVEEVKHFVDLQQQQAEEALNNGKENRKLLELAIDLVVKVLLFYVRAYPTRRVISPQLPFLCTSLRAPCPCLFDRVCRFTRFAPPRSLYAQRATCDTR